MNKLLPITLLAAVQSLACGPYFPPSYLDYHDAYFAQGINQVQELELIAREYGLIGDTPFPKGASSSAAVEREEFKQAATAAGVSHLQGAFEAYALAVRGGDTNAIPPAVPSALKEFTLYLEGTQAFLADPDLIRPEAWNELLALDESNRRHRTTWTHYMLGNLAGSHDQTDEAARHYAACRESSSELKMDPLGLAHASYKRDQLCRFSLADRIERGVAAVGYYHMAGDSTRTRFCLDHLRVDFARAQRERFTTTNLVLLEALALFNVGQDAFIRQLSQYPQLKITPRLAWFMYENGQIEQAAAYLQRCPNDDPLANWLRYRLAQRAGRTDEAIAHLEAWLDQLSRDDRVLVRFDAKKTLPTESMARGSLGMLQASRGEMMDALDSFVQALAYQDAALIAERYVPTDDLKRYIDQLPSTATVSPGTMNREVYKETSHAVVRERLAWLLARRLFREGRAKEAAPYYPEEIAPILNDYLAARAAALDPKNKRDARAAHLYHAARILRWKGMELSGTELYPDYTIASGRFAEYGIHDEAAVGDGTTRPAYDTTAPVPNLRFHYRHKATQLAGEAAQLTRDKNQRAMMLWSAGMWIQDRHPKQADPFYKQLATIRFQPLAKAADQQRWFPQPTPAMEKVHRAETYVSPKQIGEAAKAFGKE